jgi:hypothetical protein
MEASLWLREMATLMMAFYRNLYTSEGTEDMDQLLNTVPVKVTIDMNDMLLKPFSTDEIKYALFQMSSTKAPGPDGFLAHFSNDIGIFVGRCPWWCSKIKWRG